MINKQNNTTAEKLNRLSDFDKGLILYIKEKKPVIYVIFRGVSHSGMLRRFSAFMIKDNEPYYLNYLIEKVTYFKRDSDGYLKLHGCGMDMAFKMVADFSEAVFNDYKILNYRLI